MITLQANGISTPILIVGIVFLIVNLIFLAILVSLLRPWFRAFLSGTPISLMRIVGMRFRRTNVALVVDQGIAAQQAGCPISWPELEVAHLAGIDLEKAVLAYITSRKRDMNYTFQEIVDAARESRLEKLLR
ncbi:flotillin-like FloA family protein [Stieleria varia]|uniref:SigmaW regulon antibacterial n=1 Tax=Stieleria varia TaxID=2528005 RepID=A0A5C6B9F1_9BACT|nr:flotillin-like FloA family protein [Stieleria varia]TWU08580.1 SigmaW regulon antibacterial [Stieleria varia]